MIRLLERKANNLAKLIVEIKFKSFRLLAPIQLCLCFHQAGHKNKGIV
jgi:hypothetical protein